MSDQPRLLHPLQHWQPRLRLDLDPKVALRVALERAISAPSIPRSLAPSLPSLLLACWESHRALRLIAEPMSD